MDLNFDDGGGGVENPIGLNLLFFHIVSSGYSFLKNLRSSQNPFLRSPRCFQQLENYFLPAGKFDGWKTREGMKKAGCETFSEKSLGTFLNESETVYSGKENHYSLAGKSFSR